MAETGHPLKLFYNCRVLKNGKLQRDLLWIKNGKVVAPQTINDADFIYDCKNHIISPGFIDLQLNGAFGVDFLMDAEKPEAFKACRKKLLSTGCTGFCPTLITAPPHMYKKAFPYYKKSRGSPSDGADVLGIHCEGPFLSPKKKGAHPEHCIQDFDEGVESVTKCYGTDLQDLAIVTLACEKPRSTEVIKFLTDNGTKVSLGHTVATLDDCTQAVEAGANLITHLFNAMPAFHHRDPSVPGVLALCSEKTFYGIIADGIHTHETAIRLAYRLHPDGMCLVTDAIGPMGQGKGDFNLGTVKLEVTTPSEDEPLRAYVKGTDTLCGAILSLDGCVRYANTVLGIGIGPVLTLATYNPAKALGLEETKGHLNVGADADLTILNDDLEVVHTFIGGMEGYRNPAIQSLIGDSSNSSLNIVKV